MLKCNTRAEAERSARRVLAMVGTTPIPIDDAATLRVTITLGLARVGESEALMDAIRRADLALYEGKRLGRNRYVIAGA